MRTITTLLLTSLTVSIYAQKLPSVQQTSLRTPANVKIDGKASEWNNQYQAFNNATEIYYSIANNDSTLTLVVHAAHPQVIQRILENGLEFTLEKNKTDKNNVDVKILFPSLSLAETWKVLNGVGLPISGFKEWNFIPDPRLGTDSVLASQKEYSLAGANKQLITRLKEIRFAGIDQIKDTLTGITPRSPYYRDFSLRYSGYKWITIYNEDDIRAMIQFDDKKELTYELSLPIKYVKANIANGKLSYDITIHGRDGGRPGVVVYFDGSDRGKLFPELFNPTNFTGEYTLAK